jgi:hypothetical protein
MKKSFLFVLLAAAAMTSCSKDDTVVNPVDDDAIAFRASTTKTRVAVVDGANINDFAVSATFITTAAPTTTSFNYMDGVTATRDLAASTYSYAPKKYWSSEAGADIDFYSYSPAGSVNLASFVYNGTTALLSYTVPNNAAATPKKQEDFLYAKNTTAAKGGGDVALTFNHALSLVVFEAKNLNTPDVTFNVEKIELVDLYQIGTLDVIAATVGNAWTSATGSKTTYASGIPAAGVPVYGAGVAAPYVGLTAPNEGLLVLPQAVQIADNATVKVTYSATDGSGTYIYPSGSEKSFDLTPAAIFTFGIGKKYAFQFSFAAEEGISFSATVTDWDTVANVPV